MVHLYFSYYVHIPVRSFYFVAIFQVFYFCEQKQNMQKLPFTIDIKTFFNYYFHRKIQNTVECIFKTVITIQIIFKFIAVTRKALLMIMIWLFFCCYLIWEWLVETSKLCSHHNFDQLLHFYKYLFLYLIIYYFLIANTLLIPTTTHAYHNSCVHPSVRASVRVAMIRFNLSAGGNSHQGSMDTTPHVKFSSDGEPKVLGMHHESSCPAGS